MPIRLVFELYPPIPDGQLCSTAQAENDSDPDTYDPFNVSGPNTPRSVARDVASSTAPHAPLQDHPKVKPQAYCLPRGSQIAQLAPQPPKANMTAPLASSQGVPKRQTLHVGILNLGPPSSARLLNAIEGLNQPPLPVAVRLETNPTPAKKPLPAMPPSSLGIVGHRFGDPRFYGAAASATARLVRLFDSADTAPPSGYGFEGIALRTTYASADTAPICSNDICDICSAAWFIHCYDCLTPRCQVHCEYCPLCGRDFCHECRLRHDCPHVPDDVGIEEPPSDSAGS